MNANGHPLPRELALAYLAAGLSVLPIRRDGTKAPDGRLVPSWSPYQQERASEATVRGWFDRPEPPGVAVVCGAVSGSLEVIDFDTKAAEIFPAWCHLVDAEAPRLRERLTFHKTPRPGFQVWYRCPEVPVPGNTKLAEDPDLPGKERTLIETRGEGGYALVPGCPPECHVNREPYRHLAGPPLAAVQDITAAERQLLIRCARLFNTPRATAAPRQQARQGGGLSPGDDFDRRGPEWAELLEPHGWRVARQHGDTTLWLRPDKEGPGWSATTGHCRGEHGEPLLHVFSSNASPFEAEKSYGRFRAYTLLNHRGDFKEAAKDLARQGYGERRNGQARTTANTENGNGSEEEPRGAEEEHVQEAADDPHRLARIALERHRHEGCLGLRYWREEIHKWDGAAYRPVLDKELRAELNATVKEEFDRLYKVELQKHQQEPEESEESGKKKGPPVARKVTGRLISDVAQALAGQVLLPGTVKQPAWVEGAEPFPADELLVCKNGLVHLPSYVAGRPYRHPLTPRLFTANALSYDFRPDVPAPAQWLQFLGQLWPDDPQAIGVLQEWLGYCLLPDTSQHKILMVVGPKRSGKGTIARVLRALVGLDNVAGPTLAGLGTNFGLWPLLGKTVAIISDARLSGRTDAAVVTERLLSISGEDAQTIDRKNLSHVTCQLPVRFVILTNELPRLSDPSGALVGRLILLRQTRSWYGQEDTTLTARLLAELPGILLWSVEGWRRLHERGRFEQPESGKKLVADMEDLSSPIGAFLRECCNVGPGFEVLVRDLYDRWKRWCEDKGRKDPGHEQAFGRDLRAAVPALDVRQPRADGGRVRVYEGVRLKPEEEPIPL
jgi:putative DNA primase/helicase